MNYSVKQLAKIAGVSIRTLHYYDEIGLLKPASTKKNRYRNYGEKELLKLQQILFFRELEFSLKRIKQIMQSPGFDSLSALEDQQKLLEAKKQRIKILISTILETIKSLKGGEFMNANDTFSAFTDPTYQQYKDEVEKRWGNTSAYKQSIERVAKMTKQERDRVKKEGEEIAQSIACLKKHGFRYDSVEIQNQMHRFYQHLHNYYDPSYEMFKCLGQMYVDDSRFTAFYEKYAEGLAIFMRDAMSYYADVHTK